MRALSPRWSCASSSDFRIRPVPGSIHTSPFVLTSCARVVLMRVGRARSSKLTTHAHQRELGHEQPRFPPRGSFDLGTSPSCLAVNAAGTCLYSANEMDRVGEAKGGTVSAFAINRADAKTGGLAFTGQYTAVGNPSHIVFGDLARAG